MIGRTIGYGVLVTLAVWLSLAAWYGRHTLVPGEPVVRVAQQSQPAAYQTVLAIYP